MPLRITEDFDFNEISFDNDLCKLTDWSRAIPEGGNIKLDKKLKATAKAIKIKCVLSLVIKKRPMVHIILQQIIDLVF